MQYYFLYWITFYLSEIYSFKALLLSLSHKFGIWNIAIFVRHGGTEKKLRRFPQYFCFGLLNRTLVSNIWIVLVKDIFKRKFVKFFIVVLFIWAMAVCPSRGNKKPQKFRLISTPYALLLVFKQIKLMI